jgi:hypothetical protein
MRTSTGVSLLWVLLGAMLWSAWEKDWSASDDDGTCRDECGREAAADSLDGRRTGRMVHGTFWEATMELGSHGVTAT